MPLKVSHRTSFAKDVKSFKKNNKTKNLIRSAVSELIDNPEIGDLLKGNMSGFTKYSFSASPQLRILYVVYECCPIDANNPQKCRFDDVDDIAEEEVCEGMIEFVFVKTREDCNNLYKKSRKYFLNFLREGE